MRVVQAGASTSGSSLEVGTVAQIPLACAVLDTSEILIQSFMCMNK